MHINNDAFNRIALYCLFGAVLTTFFDRAIVFNFRLNDVLVIISLLMSVLSLRFLFTGWAWLSFLVIPTIILSTSIYYFITFNGDIDRLIFIYKYSLLGIVPLVVNQVVATKKDCLILLRASFILLVALSLWSILYAFLVFSGHLVGSIRPSFPFSDDFMYSDAHLYANVLVVLWAGYYLFGANVLQHQALKRYLTTMAFLVGLILTGSRNGIVLLCLLMLLNSVSWVIEMARSKRIDSRSIFLSIFSFAVLLILFLLMDYLGYPILDFISKLRVFDFGLAADGSTLSRFYKIRIALSELDSFTRVIFGVGPVGSELLWYDNGAIALLVHSGLSGLVVFLILLVKIASNVIDAGAGRYTFNFLTLILIYLIGNLVTEFYLVSRNFIPSAVLLSVFYRFIVLSRECEANK